MKMSECHCGNSFRMVIESHHIVLSDMEISKNIFKKKKGCDVKNGN